jgi:hypothetical protein
MPHGLPAEGRRAKSVAVPLLCVDYPPTRIILDKVPISAIASISASRRVIWISGWGVGIMDMPR